MSHRPAPGGLIRQSRDAAEASSAAAVGACASALESGDAVLVRPRQQLLLRGRSGRRGGVGARRRFVGVQTIPAGAALRAAAGHPRLALQRAPRAWALHVARPGAALREVRPALAPAERLSAQQRAGGADRVLRGRGSGAAGARHLPRQLRAGPGDREPRRHARAGGRNRRPRAGGPRSTSKRRTCSSSFAAAAERISSSIFSAGTEASTTKARSRATAGNFGTPW